MPLFGLAVGSFLNLTIDRVPRGESIVSPSSKCARCERRLSPLDLVPLLSYLWLRGKCRFCGARIPLRNSFVEAAAGAMFLLVAYRFGLTTTTAVILVYSSLFIVIFAIDLERTIIPDVLVFPAVFIAFVAGPFGPVGEDRSLLDTLLHVAGGGALGFITMFLIYMVSYFAYKGSVGLGFGDVKLGALIGLVAGFPEDSGGPLFRLHLRWCNSGSTFAAETQRPPRGNTIRAISYGQHYYSTPCRKGLWMVRRLVRLRCRSRDLKGLESQSNVDHVLE